MKVNRKKKNFQWNIVKSQFVLYLQFCFTSETKEWLSFNKEKQIPLQRVTMKEIKQ